jgi:hypothetical protein
MRLSAALGEQRRSGGRLGIALSASIPTTPSHGATRMVRVIWLAPARRS